MLNFESKPSYDVYDLKRLITLLRSPGGCPWDIEQTHKSIRRNMIEEAFEAAEAIDEGSAEHLQEELGDVLMQVVFHADIEESQGGFTLDDVADAVCRKLIYRHPHVFGDVKVSSSGDVLNNWDKLKRAEKSQATVSDAMEAVAKSLPGLWRCEKVQKKAAKAGFDWPDTGGAMDKLSEEVGELRAALQSGEGVMDELGDVLFAAVNVARFADIDPEDAANGACNKFISRFRKMEEYAAGEGKPLETMRLDEMEELYQRAKKALEK